VGEDQRGGGAGRGESHTLRYYERRGLPAAPVRSRSGYRAYPDGAVRRVRFIKRAQDLGFTLAEVESLLHLER
jgi:DNA-binding transcriptional MerR regulator